MKRKIIGKIGTCNGTNVILIAVEHFRYGDVVMLKLEKGGYWQGWDGYRSGLAFKTKKEALAAAQDIPGFKEVKK